MRRLIVALALLAGVAFALPARAEYGDLDAGGKAWTPPRISFSWKWMLDEGTRWWGWTGARGRVRAPVVGRMQSAHRPVAVKR